MRRSIRDEFLWSERSIVLRNGVQGEKPTARGNTASNLKNCQSTHVVYNGDSKHYREAEAGEIDSNWHRALTVT